MPEAEIVWAGNPAYRHWLTPLDISICPGRTKKDIDSLYARSTIPAGLLNSFIVWFGLEKYPLSFQDRRIIFLRSIESGVHVPPRELYLKRLAYSDFCARQDWLLEWRRLFGRKKDKSSASDNEVLLFPGSGHRSKCWPLVQFFKLARWLEYQGLRPCFVLGPVELERGMKVQGFPAVMPDDLLELQERIQGTGLVVGNDCGPMHLAGYLGIPGVSLFGPTSGRQWGPPGMTLVRAEIPCRPCTHIATIECRQPLCMENISQQQVQTKVLETMAKKKTGLFSPPEK